MRRVSRLSSNQSHSRSLVSYAANRATERPKNPLAREGLFYSYSLFLFTTPYIGYSILLSALTREIRFLAKSGVKHEFDPSPAHRNRKQAGTTINAICF